jgi:hypothetical protein
MNENTRLTRRSFLTALVGASLLDSTEIHASELSTPAATPASYAWPVPFQLGEGRAILDWRLFPTTDALRFIAEVRNTTNSLIAHPVIGVHTVTPQGHHTYGWGVPFTSVIHPGESSFAIGIAPESIQTDADWGVPEWLNCNHANYVGNRTGVAQLQDIELEYSYQIPDPELLKATLQVTNNSGQLVRQLYVQGIVRDPLGRICGGMATSHLQQVQPGETREFAVNAIPSLQMQANPFVLVDSLEGCSVSFSTQPSELVTAPGCPAVMPWNRQH